MTPWGAWAATFGILAVAVAWWPWSIPLVVLIWYVWKTS